MYIQIYLLLTSILELMLVLDTQSTTPACIELLMKQPIKLSLLALKPE